MLKENIFSLWVLVLFFEVGWLFVRTQNVYNTSDLVFVIVLIIVTIAVGTVGIYIFGKSKP
jgi:Tfp pilus assembly protein PilZ